MFVPLVRERVFEFFSDAANLALVTPPETHFRILTPVPIVIRQDTIIEYRLRVLGLPLAWRSLISRWDPPREFVDEQLSGPYKSWIHTHRFSGRPGGTMIEDHIEYRLPLEPFGDLAYPIVRHQLRKIFAFRHAATQKILISAAPDAGATST